MAKNIHQPSSFTEANLKALAKDTQAGRFATLQRHTVSDDIVTGLRAVVYKSGLINFSVSYHFGGERPFMKLGILDPKSPDHITVEEARHLARIVIGLANKGIDVQEGLHRRLIRELKRDGLNWKPK